MNGVPDGRLRQSELRPTEGSWHGHLFDNPSLGLPASLTWSFEIAYAEIDRDDGSTPVNVTIDWVPLPCRSWRNLGGQSVTCLRFAEPVETTVYFFEHFRYDGVDIAISKQEEESIRVLGSIRGDIDGLGIAKLDFDEWLRFDGIYVNLSGPAPTTADEANARLAEFLDSRELTPQAGNAPSSIFRFAPLRA